MQTNMTKQAARRKARKALIVVLTTALGVLAIVNGTTAQPAANAPAPANTARAGGGDLITDGLTDGKLMLSVNKTAVVTTKSPIKRIVIGHRTHRCRYAE